MPPSSALDCALEVEAADVAVAAAKMHVVCADAAPLAMAMALDAAVVSATRCKRSVHFADADVIEFEPTVWTATVSSDGAPVGLSSKVRRRTRRRLDSWEEERTLCRVVREEYMEHGYLEPEERLDILEAAGHAMSTINHVENDTMRINRERWESNEHDLLYQYGLGEPVSFDLDEEDEQLLLQGIEPDVALEDGEEEEDDDEEMLDDDDDDEDAESLQSYYFGHQNMLSEDDDMRVAMEAMDSYDSRKFDEWAWDYSTDNILHDTTEQADDGDVPYPEDLFDLRDLDGDFAEMSTSPSDVSAASECMISSCVPRFDMATKPGKTASDANTSSASPYAIV